MLRRAIQETGKTIGREVAWSTDWLYRFVAPLRRPGRIKRSPEQFDIYVSGFPRSGNHYYTIGLEVLTEGAKRINPVSHLPPYTRKAWKMGIPSIVLIRNPIDACTSWSIYRNVSLKHSLRFYLQYHRMVDTVIPEAHVAVFESYTRSMTDEAEKLRSRLDIPIRADLSEQQLQEEIFDRMPEWGPDQRPLPTRERTEKKQQLLEQLGAPRLKSLRSRAEDLYFDVVETYTDWRPAAERPAD